MGRRSGGVGSLRWCGGLLRKSAGADAGTTIEAEASSTRARLYRVGGVLFFLVTAHSCGRDHAASSIAFCIAQAFGKATFRDRRLAVSSGGCS